MSEITLRQLEYFVAVTEARSMTLAADRCHVSQATVSVAIAQLEATLGATLVIRRPTKGIALTAEGQAALARARNVLESVDDLGDAVRGAHGGLSGRLVVGCFRTLSMHVLPTLVEWFAQQHPDVQIDFVEGSGPEILGAMHNGEIQLCVVYEAQLAPACDVEVLRTMRRQVVLSPDHPLASTPAIHFHDLARHAAILIDEEPALQRTLLEFQRYGASPQVRWRSSSVQAILSIVGRNLAYSLLMQPVAFSPLGDPLVFRPVADAMPTNSVVAALPQGVKRSALVGAALEALHTLWPEDAARRSPG